MTTPDDAPAAAVPPAPPLRATYRLQMHGGFGFDDARAIVPYLERLGVSHAYLSPVLHARAGSTHGYDVIDPRAVNPELGGEPARRALVGALRERGLGLLLDIVPNHMAAGPDNPYWRDVLEHGRASRWARWFDIDWHAPDESLRGRLLLPVLGDWLPQVLARRELTVAWERDRLRVRYWENDFPVDPQTAPRVLTAGLEHAREAAGDGERAALELLAALAERFARLPARTARGAAARERRHREAGGLWAELAALAAAEPVVRSHLERAAAAFATDEAGPARMRRFLDRQAYSLVYWRRAAREINYRRFFNINELVALRTEHPEVFEETHALVLDWVRDGGVDGLRIDHVDGLRDPRRYLQRLRAAVDARRPGEGAARVPVLVEKILTPGESLRADWPVDGTTGYETLNDLEAVFLAPDGVARLEQGYDALLRLRERGLDFHAVALAGKRKILRGSLSADVGRLMKLLAPIARRDARTAHLGRDALVDAIVEAIAGLGVYRAYVDAEETPDGARAHPDDVAQVERALAIAGERGEADPALLALLREVLLLEEVDALPEPERTDRRRLASRFQQISGPAMAKGVEDTALYLWVPLLSRNEVGGEPDRPLRDAVGTLHAANAERARDWPRALVTVSTHDTKRGAETRARLDVLSEMPDAWWEAVSRWRRMNAPLLGRTGRRRAPDPNTEYLLYQTMLGVWPVAGDAPVPDADTLDALRERVRAYMEKAVREGKSRSGWITPDPAFEAALGGFVDALHDPARSTRFLAELGALARRVAPAGYWNALARTVLHLTVPGVPDLYQGTELWDFTLVDPDNRRPVDFAMRSALLDRIAAAYAADSPDDAAALVRSLVAAPDDGAVKLLVVHRLLRARRERAALFDGGAYLPLAARGARAAHVVAFARRAPDGGAAVVVVPRLTLALSGGAPPLGEGVWGDTTVPLPDAAPGRRWRCALTGRVVEPAGDVVHVGVALADLPCTVLLDEPLAGPA